MFQIFVDTKLFRDVSFVSNPRNIAASGPHPTCVSESVKSLPSVTVIRPSSVHFFYGCGPNVAQNDWCVPLHDFVSATSKWVNIHANCCCWRNWLSSIIGVILYSQNPFPSNALRRRMSPIRILKSWFGSINFRCFVPFYREVIMLLCGEIRCREPHQPPPLLFISKCYNNAYLIFILTTKYVSDKK